jgi:hypothetical protein
LGRWKKSVTFPETYNFLFCLFGHDPHWFRIEYA